MKAKRIITIVLTVIVVGLVVMSGVFKFLGGQEVTDGMAKVGVSQYTILLGCMEVGFAALFAFPRTLKIGFILLSCYFAGALATELSHAAPLNAITLLVLIWVTAFLRDKSIFLTTAPAAL